ncbi:site-specific integrase [Paeniglutamicibacter antarcticus]|uniref:Site-specific integrase n=1 Tax=Arthrobacter terrae TaxID=2935737 RepID=A0A931CH22_9MICC|nr:site-specific integrase [Arthrobacter terrae]MBG0738442.1 site-specific integrase [Arthrobacter terrae]
MSRPPLPIGSWGHIEAHPIVSVQRSTPAGTARSVNRALPKSERQKLTPGALRKFNRWRAMCWFRDHDGVTRKVERVGPTANKAKDLLISYLLERSTPTIDDLTAESTVDVLWSTYLEVLVKDGRAARTLDLYRYVAVHIVKGLGQVRLREATTQRLDRFLRAIEHRHGPNVARTCRAVLSGMFRLAVQYDALPHNPVSGVGTIRVETKAARALTADELRGILDAVHSSSVILDPKNKLHPTLQVGQYCERADLADVVTLLAATGVRISEALGLRWSDVDLDNKTVSINGKVIRAKGLGLVREDYTKSRAGERILPLPDFAVDMLVRREVDSVPNIHAVVFPSEAKTLRDPNGVSNKWQKVRACLGFPWATSHTFRKTLATLIDSQGLSARVGADQLGHANISMTQDKYMGRRTTHAEVAELLNRVIH